MSDTILSHFDYPILRHICNSFGIIRFPDAQYEMVRWALVYMAWHQKAQSKKDYGT